MWGWIKLAGMLSARNMLIMLTVIQPFVLTVLQADLSTMPVKYKSL